MGLFHPYLNLVAPLLCWCLVNVTLFPKTSSASFFSDNGPISITPISSQFFKSLLAKQLSQFLESTKLLPAGRFGFRKGLTYKILTK